VPCNALAPDVIQRFLSPFETPNAVVIIAPLEREHVLWRIERVEELEVLGFSEERNCVANLATRDGDEEVVIRAPLVWQRTVAVKE